MNRREYLASHLGLVARFPAPAAAIALAGCGMGREQLATVEGATMGTTYRVKAVIDPGEADSLAEDVAAIVARIDALMSTYRPQSELSRFNASSGRGWVGVSADTHAVISAANATAAASEGAFDVTVGPLVNLWGFGSQGRAGAPPSDEAIADVAARIGHARLEAAAGTRAVRKSRPGVYADLSGIAKGYAVDRLAGRLDAGGVESYLVEIGGELRARGRKPDGGAWRVGIERPSRGRRVPLAVLDVEDRAIATSGDYRNFFTSPSGQVFSHTIDPTTGHPVTHDLASVTVVARTAMEADSLSTAMMVMGHERGLELAREAGAAALFLVRDGTELVEHQSAGFAELRAG